MGCLWNIVIICGKKLQISLSINTIISCNANTHFTYLDNDNSSTRLNAPIKFTAVNNFGKCDVNIKKKKTWHNFKVYGSHLINSRPLIPNPKMVIIKWFCQRRWTNLKKGQTKFNYKFVEMSFSNSNYTIF